LAHPRLSEEDSADAKTRHRTSQRPFKESKNMKTTNAAALSRKLKISKSRSLEAVIKADLISAVLKSAEEQDLTHVEISRRSGLSRSAVTGILSGSLQKVTLDRILRLIEAVGLTVETRVRKAA
jgi:predicted XRE-type DNA-binding protein